MIRPSAPLDALELADTLRDADVREIALLTGKSPIEALSVGYFHSDTCMSVVKQGRVIAMFGIVRLSATTGSVWLLTAPDIVRHKRELLEFAPAWLDEQAARYAVLTNFVTESNAVHLRLIRRLGFTLGDPISIPGTRERVIKFERSKPCVPRP